MYRSRASTFRSNGDSSDTEYPRSSGPRQCIARPVRAGQRIISEHELGPAKPGVVPANYIPVATNGSISNPYEAISTVAKICSTLSKQSV